jgi:tRNA pseudouridine38-40 synthase
LASFLAVLEYDGTSFHGSQVQTGQRTVQGELELALARLDGRPVKTCLAGRTDTGVHALGQVAAFSLQRTIADAPLAAALNGLMPRDVSVREATTAPEQFSPRYWAISRRYEYRILPRAQRSALADRWAWHVPWDLNVEAMGRAAAALVGAHDFGAFGRPPQGRNSRRTVSRAVVSQCGVLLTVSLEADAFLRRMVRTIVGTLADVGRGRLGPDSVAEALVAAKDPVAAAAPAKGLVLAAVAYNRARLGNGTGLWWSDEPLAERRRDEAIEEFDQ